MHVLYKSESHFLGSIYYYYYFFFDTFERRSKNKNEFIYFIPIEKHMFTFPHMDFVKNTNLLLLLLVCSLLWIIFFRFILHYTYCNIGLQVWLLFLVYTNTFFLCALCLWRFCVHNCVNSILGCNMEMYWDNQVLVRIACCL